MAFHCAGRRAHPELAIVFSMLAGLAPLQHERLCSRGDTAGVRDDPLTFYDTSSYGPAAIGQLADLVGRGQLVYGSDRPVLEPSATRDSERLDWSALSDATERLFPPAQVLAR
jgi:hypothetical protein